MKNETNQSALQELYEKTGADGVNPDELSAEARAFLGTQRGRSEARVARSIAAGAADLPRSAVPLRLREMVFDRLFRPAYGAWHLALACVSAALSPLFFHYLVQSVDVHPNWLPVVFAAYGLLNLMLIFPLAFYILQKHRKGFEDFEKSVDETIEHPGRLLDRFRRAG